MNFKTEKMVVILLVSTLVSSVLAISIPKVLAEATAVKVMPQALEFGPDLCVGTEFTITVEVHDVLDLYGFDTQFGWNTSYISYVSHTLHTPVETYPDGLLHQPTMTIRNTVNEAGIPGTMPGTMYWAAASSMPPASPFDGSGIAFDMTFTIVKQPMMGEGDVTFDLEITRSQLSDHLGWPIIHSVYSGTVTIHALEVDAHDVAVVDVTTNATLVSSGDAVEVTVVVENQGDYTETFDVTAYNGTSVIGTQTVTGLASKATETLYFTWDTTGAYGSYTIKAEASTVTDSCDLTDNTLVDGAVFVRGLGDANMDGIVDIFDIGTISAHWYPGPPIGPLGYSIEADMNFDGSVDIFDIGITSANWGKTYPY